MDSFATLIDQISKYQNWLLVAALAILFIWLIALSRRVGRTASWITRMLRGTEPVNLERLLEENLGKLEQLDTRMRELEATGQELSQKLTDCVQRVGIVRFDAFEDVGGQQSFALVLMDGQQDGVVISSLYGRQDSRCYAKPIRAGQATYPPSEEEQQAIEQALRSSPGEAGRQ